LAVGTGGEAAVDASPARTGPAAPSASAGTMARTIFFIAAHSKNPLTTAAHSFPKSQSVPPTPDAPASPAAKPPPANSVAKLPPPAQSRPSHRPPHSHPQAHRSAPP